MYTYIYIYNIHSERDIIDVIDAMILVFSLESHINATGENGHSHPFPNRG